MRYRFALYDLKKQMEIQNRREYSWSEMARGAGLHRNTLERMATNENARIDLGTIGKLIAYFDTQGMKLTPNDLIVLDSPAESPTPDTPS